MKRERGFTLIELMIVVAIIGILASIAIPSFQAMQKRAKRAELPLNLESLRVAEKSYHAEFDTYLTCAPNPAAMNNQRQDFGNPGGGWTGLGWAPDGKVFGQYEVSATQNDFTGFARSDIDLDSIPAVYESTNSLKPYATTGPSVF
jgi:prepilin-type N-terminal cleavage/methylation domain-containing protein